MRPIAAPLILILALVGCEATEGPEGSQASGPAQEQETADAPCEDGVCPPPSEKAKGHVFQAKTKASIPLDARAPQAVATATFGLG